MSNPDSQTASYTFANWSRQIEGVPAQLTIEAMLFTDTWVTGQVTGIGPYAFLNTLEATARLPPTPAIGPTRLSTRRSATSKSRR
jgi:xanthine/uracil/vitamin C permease (AzgA family)